MTQKEYINTKKLIRIVTSFIKGMPLNDFIAMLDKNESLWMKRSQNIAKIRRRAEALRAVQVMMEEEE